MLESGKGRGGTAQHWPLYVHAQKPSHTPACTHARKRTGAQTWTHLVKAAPTVIVLLPWAAHSRVVARLVEDGAASRREQAAGARSQTQSTNRLVLSGGLRQTGGRRPVREHHPACARGCFACVPRPLHVQGHGLRGFLAHRGTGAVRRVHSPRVRVEARARALLKGAGRG